MIAADTHQVVRGGGHAMRDAADTMTAEIPGIEPLPPKPVRTTIAERMAAVVYQGPKEVRGCRNCRHRGEQLHDVGSWAESTTLRCKLHDFPVQKAGLCIDHEE